MSVNRFYISRIALSGSEIEEAEVFFKKGLNIITGPSDTGKTFILQCIDYMFGSKKIIHDFPEAEPYDTVIMDLILNNEEVLTFKRNLKGGAFSLFKDGKKIKELTSKHNADNIDNLSNYLLSKIDLSGKNVVKNASGSTQSLSLRNIAHLSFISEENIIKSSSPVFSGIPSSKTVEKSILKLITSGKDDSSVVASEDKTISKSKTEAKIELIKDMLKKKQRRVDELQIDIPKDQIEQSLSEFSNVYKEIQSQLEGLEGSVKLIESNRQETWQELNRIESRKNVLSGLKERFDLLRKQYASDLLRLDAISESGFRLGELTEEKCPICGALPEHHDVEHLISYEDPRAISEACTIEAERIRSLIDDLEDTNKEICDESIELGVREAELKKQRLEQDEKLKDHFKPRINSLIEHSKKNEKKRDSLILAAEFYSQIAELTEELISYSEPVPVDFDPKETTDNGEIDSGSLCSQIQEILKSWKFPNLGRVAFNKKSYDIDIDGRARESHGKGVRAITHSAYTLGIMATCSEKQLPHPGIVVLDSPLVVYREPDEREGGETYDVKESLLQDTAIRFKDEQVIILENEKVSDELEKKLNGTVIRFSGNNEDRSGFLKRIENPEPPVEA